MDLHFKDNQTYLVEVNFGETSDTFSATVINADDGWIKFNKKVVFDSIDVNFWFAELRVSQHTFDNGLTFSVVTQLITPG